MGGGGFGKTFEITDRGTRKVLKVLLESQPKAVSLFKQEANALSQLNSPGIPHVDSDGYFTFQPKGCDRSLHCLVMEKINGPTLKDWIKKRGYKPISEERAVTWLKQLAEILDMVHRQHYFHRDIKPDNIMLRPNGQLVLIDFGTAREVTETYLAKVGQGQNVTGIVSPGYTPPEQVNGKAVPQSDFFALGRTFVFLLTGKPPTFFSENPRSGKLIWRDKATHISAQLADVIDYMMAPFPGQRPQKPHAILQCLAEVEEQAEWSSSTMAGVGSSPRSNKDSSEHRNDFATSNTGMTKTVAAESEKAKRNSGKAVAKITSKILTTAVILGMIVGGTQVYGYLRYERLPYNPWPRFLPQLWSSSYDFVPTKNISSRGRVEAVAIDRSGQWFASSVRGNISVWRLGESQPIRNISTEGVVVTSLAIDPERKLIARGGSDAKIRLWKLQEGNRFLTIAGPSSQVNAIKFSPAGSVLASGGNDGTVQTWDVESGQELNKIDHGAPVYDVAVTPNGNIASAGADGTIKLWNLQQNTPLKTLRGHQGAVKAVAISNNGQLLASGSEDGTVHIWNLETGQPLHAFPSGDGPVNAVLFTPNSKNVIFASHSIQMWSFQNSQRVFRLTEHQQAINDLALSSNGRVLVSGSDDRSVIVWQSP
jgi:serine/threonine protein kinase